MAAVSRFVEFSVTSTTVVTGQSASGQSNGFGTPAFNKATVVTADMFTIGSSNNKLSVDINGTANIITLASGTDLDPRFVARDIEYKLNSISPGNVDFDYARCEWRNGFGPISNPGTNDKNSLVIWSGRLGANSGNNDIALASTTNDARTTLGWSTGGDAGDGVDYVPGYTGSITLSGVYGGQFGEMYTIQISNSETVGAVTSSGANTYAGTATVGGLFLGASPTTYTLSVSTTNGNVMGAGTGAVPSFTVTSVGVSDSNSNPIELLYPNHWYDVGNKGVRIKFSDSPFGNGDLFGVTASGASGAGGAAGTAKYIWSSSLEDSSKALGIGPLTTNTATPQQLGSKGVTFTMSNSGSLGAGNIFNVICRGPRPSNTNVTQLNFGNVTVSTNSSVKVVWFELISGAVSMSTVKFSLQSDGSFAHHDEGDSDTEFRFGTVGAGSNAPGSGPTSNAQFEFPVGTNSMGNIAATDIDSDTPPSYLFATKQDLAVVSSADNAETIGNFLGGVVSDFIYLAIKLGANETGANSTINYRCYFDFS